MSPKFFSFHPFLTLFSFSPPDSPLQYNLAPPSLSRIFPFIFSVSFPSSRRPYQLSLLPFNIVFRLNSSLLLFPNRVFRLTSCLLFLSLFLLFPASNSISYFTSSSSPFPSIPPSYLRTSLFSAFRNFLYNFPMSFPLVWLLPLQTALSLHFPFSSSSPPLSSLSSSLRGVVWGR